MFCYSGFALGPSITDALLLAEVASRGSFDFGAGPFSFWSFSNEMIFVADRPEGSAHFDSRAFCSAFWLAGFALRFAIFGQCAATISLVDLRAMISLVDLRATVWRTSGGHWQAAGGHLHFREGAI